MKKNFFFLILGSCLAMATACGGQEAAPDKDLDMNSSGIQEQEPSGKQEVICSPEAGRRKRGRKCGEI